MRGTGAYRIWQIIYPIGIYYVVSSLVYFALLQWVMADEGTYMLRQLICAAAAIPFVLPFYRQDQAIEDNVYGKRRLGMTGRTVLDALSSLALGALCGIGVNNVIAMTPLIRRSAGFSEANNAFFAGGIAFELLGSCLVIPVAEELLYRGVVYRRLRMWLGVLPAVALSALVFGLVHANLVQLLYAGILGLLLAFLMEQGKSLLMPVMAHIAANAAAVVRQETGWLSFAYEPTAAGICVTAVILLLASALLAWKIREYQN